MKPTEYISLFGHLQDPNELRRVLDLFKAMHSELYDVARSIATPNSAPEVLRFMNMYESELRVANSVIEQWSKQTKEQHHV